MSSYDAVIFDLDGTLADTLADIAGATNHVLVANGYMPHPVNAYKLFVGNGLRNLVISSLPEDKRTEAIVDACYAEVIAYYEEHFADTTHLYAGIPELLDILSANHIKMAVLSNKADAITQKICALLLNRWTFETIIGENERFPRKPNPESAKHIASAIGVLPEKVLYLGDSGVDMQTAKAAGFYPVGAAWGFRSKEELKQNGAMKLIDHPLDLLNLWENELFFKKDQH